LRSTRVIPALMILAAIVSAHPAAAAEPQPVTSVEGITEYRLDNGLRVLLFPDPAKATTTVCITYLVGSRHEGYGETGMAHLLEHLAFKGTPRHPNVSQEQTAHGCRSNGSTWFDRTNYFETFAATDSNLAWALDMESDRMVNSNIAAKDLESEHTVVRNELESGENNPTGVLEERVFSTAYLWHNYGKSTIGARSDVVGVPVERVRAFYTTYYQPDNAILVVAGNLDVPKTLGMIQTTFGRIPRPERTLPHTYTEEPAQDGERTVTLRRVGDTQMTALAYHIPAGSHSDYPAVAMLALILGDEPSGRLYKALVEGKKATSVRCDAFQLAEPGAVYVSAEARMDQSIEEARDELIRVTESAGRTAPTPEEVDRARERLLKDWEMSMRNSERAAIGLSEWSAMGDWRLIFVHRDRLRSVTAADVQRVAAAYFVPTNRTVGLFVPTKQPERAEIPAAPDVASLVKDYTGGEGLAQGQEFDASPEAIERTIVRASLSPGMKIVMLPKKTRAETVQILVNLHMGDEQSLKNLARVGELTAGMLERGTTERTRQQIQDETDRLKIRIDVRGSATEVTASAEATRETLPDAIRLLAQILRQPSFPEAEFAQLKQETLLDLEGQKSEPFSRAFTTMQRHVNPYPADDVRYVASPEEQIAQVQAVSIEQVRSFHAGFYGASASELVAVGDLDPRAFQALAVELFGDWRSVKPFARLVPAWQDLPPIHERIETPDKENAVLSAGLKIPMRDDDPDYPALLLGNFMTGGGGLSSRLADRIRQKEGLSYGVGSMFFASAFFKDAYFGGRAIYAPQNVDRLESAFKEEIAKVVAAGFTAQEVADAKSGWLQRQTVSRSTDREIVRSLAQREYQGRTLAWDAGLEKRVAALTPEEINGVVRKYIDPTKINIVEAGDFAKGGKADATPGRSGPGPGGGEAGAPRPEGGRGGSHSMSRTK
jgi:zinc protease